MTMVVTITEVLSSVGTVWTFGTADGRTVGVDHRPAHDLAEALDAQGEVEAEVEGWQVL